MPKCSCISPRGGNGFSAGIKGIFGFKYKRTSRPVFNSHFKNEDISLRSGLNATEVTAYQYLGMTKIAGALNMLPTTILNKSITNDSTQENVL
jgi:hypothetical protein